MELDSSSLEQHRCCPAGEGLATTRGPLASLQYYDVPVPLPAREEAYMPDVARILDAAYDVQSY